MDDSRARWREVDDYFADALTPEDDVLVQARASSASSTLPHAEVATNQGALLGLLARMVDAKRVLEIGTLSGYSTIWLARAVGPQGRVVSLELSAENAALAEANIAAAGLADVVEIRIGSATTLLAAMASGDEDPYDLVFVDADKESNPAYVSAALELSHSGTVIVVDNVVRDGIVVDAASSHPDVRGVRAMVELLRGDTRVDATAIQTVGMKGWDGFVLVRVR